MFQANPEISKADEELRYCNLFIGFRAFRRKKFCAAYSILFGQVVIRVKRKKLQPAITGDGVCHNRLRQRQKSKDLQC